MEENLITILISFITTIVTALVTYFFAIKNDKRKAKSELDKKQRHEYYLPFKYCAKEFLARIKHIENRLSDDDEKYKGRFSPKMSLINKPQPWYFEPRKLNDPGGYFTTSTIYMTCILFFRMRRIQWEHPFIPLKFDRSIEEIVPENDEQLKRCLKSWENDLNKSNIELTRIKNRKEIYIDEIIEFIRVPFALWGGIPYSLHDSYGDFIKKDDQIMNFEEFAKQLASEETAIKFKPIIDYWTQLVGDDNIVDRIRIDKLRKLIVILSLVQYGKIK